MSVKSKECNAWHVERCFCEAASRASTFNEKTDLCLACTVTIDYNADEWPLSNHRQTCLCAMCVEYRACTGCNR